ncbi:MAG: hypothetical protein ACI841_005177 [Planctomycetota bacterium]|jgi:hypothetical protein
MGLFGFFKKKGASAEMQKRVQQHIAELDSPDAAVRLAACEGLRDLAPHSEPATERLLEMINDPDGDVCNMASQATTDIQASLG